MADYRKLDVWKRAHAQTVIIYRTTSTFPSTERFGLVSQMRRAAASIGANLAEGCGRRGDGDFARFIDIAKGSSDELDYHLLLAHDLQFIDDVAYDALAAENSQVGSMLTGLSRAVRQTKQRDLSRSS